MFLATMIQVIVLSTTVFLILNLLIQFFKPRLKASAPAMQQHLKPLPAGRTIQLLLLTVLSRVFLCLIAYLAAMLFLDEPNNLFISYQQLWIQSDAPHYLTIAKNWYVSSGEDAVLLVFLPLYPMLIRLLSYLSGSYMVSGILISLLCYAASSIVLYQCTLLLGYGEDTAFRSVKYLLIFPASFFVLGTFSESLFILLSLLFFLFLLKKSWLAAAVFGSLAAFTRYYGILLIIPYAIELLQQYIPEKNAPPNKHTAPREILYNGLPVCLIPLGTGAYLMVNWIVAGEPFRFLTYQKEHWNQSFGLFFRNVGTMVLNALSFDPSTRAALFIPQLVMILLMLALLVYGVLRRFRLSMMAYLTIYFITAISATWLLSFPRYVFGAVPVFILLAVSGERKITDTALSIFCSCGLIYLMLAYVCHYHVY